MWTRPLRPLTENTSLGFAAIRFAENVCDVTLYPWQKWLLIHALELSPGVTVKNMHRRGKDVPLFRFRTVVVLVARQQGKSTLSQVLALFMLYMLGINLILGTAQDLDTAEEVWDGALEIIEETPELAELADKPIMVNGKKTIRLKSGERYKVKAANRRAGRGLSGDLIMLDELREHQTWDAWGAITKTTIARPNAQVWAMSNAGDATSVVLRYLRKMAHKPLGDPDGINADDDPESLLPAEGVPGMDDAEESSASTGDESLGIFEWSAPPGCDVMDPEGWAQANPSLGHGLVTERSLMSAAKTDPEWVFRTEVLCQWSDGSLEGPFPPGAWEAGQWVAEDHPGEEMPQIVGNVVACVDIAVDRGRAHIAFAGRDAEGFPQVELVASRSVSESAGTGWVIDWLTERAEIIDAVTGQTRGAPVSDLMPQLEEAGLPVVSWSGPELTSGTGKFYDAVRDNGFRHFPQPVVDVAAATATPKLTDGGSFLWDRRKSPVDVSPLIAFTGALWCLDRPVEKKPEPRIRQLGG
ncbi:terminase large subunit domain-containing protein [Nesterenkonia sp. HG001]|uniref:terminase large subunit domain-containing protein n=1 Tax=Nesterenkonia sp. HG001 TaxID=2983207 RepID=UPI002AC7C4F1|nr:terminase large subunit [Nesterenkonia sp. HG001]MDZ5077878.1 terminase large subunit [Nesterenkonia sp. HG001]